MSELGIHMGAGTNISRGEYVAGDKDTDQSVEEGFPRADPLVERVGLCFRRVSSE